MTIRHRFLTWWNRRFRLHHATCIRCGNPLTVLRNTTAAYQGLCNPCARLP